MAKSSLFVMVVTHTFHRAPTSIELVGDRYNMGLPILFETRQEAEDYLSGYSAGTYFLRHDEVGRPSYEVRTVKSLPKILAEQIG